MSIKTLLLATVLAAASPAVAQQSAAPEGASVAFIGLQDGDTVQSPVTVFFGLAGMGVAPAGVEQAATGHHHLLVDRPVFGEGEGGAEELTLNIPSDDNHLHFGGGQTQVTLDLASGTHSLQLVLGDANHIPHDPPVMSDRITITVE